MPFVLNWKTVQIIKMLRIWVILSAAQSRVPANIVGIKLRFRVIIRCLPLALLLEAGRVKFYTLTRFGRETLRMVQGCLGNYFFTRNRESGTYDLTICRLQTSSESYIR